MYFLIFPATCDASNRAVCLTPAYPTDTELQVPRKYDNTYVYSVKTLLTSTVMGVHFNG